MKTSIRSFLALLSLATLFEASAAVFAVPSDARLTRSADAIVTGTVLHVQPQLNAAGEIESVVRISVDQVLLNFNRRCALLATVY